jgi:hypothetical protein
MTGTRLQLPHHITLMGETFMQSYQSQDWIVSLNRATLLFALICIFAASLGEHLDRLDYLGTLSHLENTWNTWNTEGFVQRKFLRSDAQIMIMVFMTGIGSSGVQEEVLCGRSRDLLYQHGTAIDSTVSFARALGLQVSSVPLRSESFYSDFISTRTGSGLKR